MTFPAYKHFRANTFEAEVSKLVMRLVRHYDQDERETDGAEWVQNCEKRFRPEGKNSRTQIGFNTFMKEATGRGSSFARIPENIIVHSCY